MQAVLINLEEYEVGVDAMSALATPRSNLQAPLDALEQALPAIRSLTLQAARLDTDRSTSAVQDQALAMTRLDTQMRAQITEINEALAAAPLFHPPWPGACASCPGSSTVWPCSRSLD
ncbi:MAG: hypothetical protein JKP95_02060 [Oceanicaulis sp.]|nr:hypothetical protein [Oceanicaulis sp.]